MKREQTISLLEQAISDKEKELDLLKSQLKTETRTMRIREKEMQKTLKENLLNILDPERESTDIDQIFNFEFAQDFNDDAVNGTWLKNNTSWIYNVGVMAAIDANKCDYARIAIGIKKREGDNVRVIGYLNFSEGENDDMGRVMYRALELVKRLHPAFDKEL